MKAFIESINAERLCRFRCSAGTGCAVIAEKSPLPTAHDYCTMELDVQPAIVLGENGQVVDADRPAIECEGHMTRFVLQMESHDGEICFVRLSVDCLLMLEVEPWNCSLIGRFLRIEEKAANLVAYCLMP